MRLTPISHPRHVNVDRHYDCRHVSRTIKGEGSRPVSIGGLGTSIFTKLSSIITLLPVTVPSKHIRRLNNYGRVRPRVYTVKAVPHLTTNGAVGNSEPLRFTC